MCPKLGLKVRNVSKSKQLGREAGRTYPKMVRKWSIRYPRHGRRVTRRSEKGFGVVKMEKI